MEHTGPAASSEFTRASLLLRLNGTGEPRDLAWQEFHDLYAPMIGAFARRMSVPVCDLDDIVQDVLLGFFNVSPQFSYDRSRGRFRGYLKTCTWHVIQRRFARRLRISGRPVDEIDPKDPSVDSQWNDVWDLQLLTRAMNALRQQYAARDDKRRTFDAFERYALLGQSADVVATALGMTVESVHQAKSRISRALKAEVGRLSDAMGG